MGMNFVRCAVTALAAAAVAAPAAAKDTAAEMQALVDQSNATLKAFRADKDMASMRANLAKAKGVLIAPEVVKAGFILGGSGGHAVLLSRGKGGSWGGPAAYTLRTANVGFQAGASKSETVMLVMTQKGMDKLVGGDFKFGSDVSVAAGDKGGGAETNMAADMITYAKSKGVYGGVNFSGTGVSINKDLNRAYYGKDVKPADILGRKVAAPAGAKPLLATVAGK